MEHRLFGADITVSSQVHLLGGRNAAGGEPAPDTLLGPEGSGESLILKAGIRSGPSPWTNHRASSAGARNGEGPPVC